ncbi:hypothetical protein C9374_007881 [Naegleria lovaniensis]|uniref:Rhodanese domain-containing protein n=1 Tax=Naegleria lovaniensis TaxID=51637 RepID=A0AA88KIC2_NAELO|nr:uncharacterized protein C9374_007881 [Naegleria lovaniensis]KAG2378733.1 hypothetical protein C9374_007881 [Naegleria lovaniensis]
MTIKNHSHKCLSIEEYIHKVDRQQLNQNQDSVQVIDVRSQHDFEQARFILKNSINLPYSTLETNLKLLDPHKQVVVVCQHGCENSASAHACSILSKHGIQCQCIEGGFNEINKRLSTSNNSNMDNTLLPFVLENRRNSKIWTLERQARFSSGFLTLCGLLGYFLSKKRVFLLGSGSLAVGGTYSAITDSCGLAKVLRKMPWNKTNFRWL